MRCWRDGRWHADELANLSAKLEQENATLRELAEGLAEALEIFRTQDAPKDALSAINDALRPYYAAYPDAPQAARYRAACPGEGQDSSASNSPTASRESQG
jgi:hypothetical protein